MHDVIEEQSRLHAVVRPLFFFSSRRRHTRFKCDWSSDVCSSDLQVDSVSVVPLIFQNFSLFAQDTWRVRPRLTITYGLRWDVDFTPKTSSGPSLPTVDRKSVV